MKTKVQVKDLRKGDDLGTCKIMTGPTPVRSNPFHGINKMMVGVEFPNGNLSTRVWGKYTTVVVLNR